jgi:putative ABC transport system permease protein
MLRFAWRNLVNRPVRTILSVLGLSVAIAGMVGLFAISGGIDHLVTQTFEKIPGLLVQQQGAPIPLFSSLPAAWKDEIAALPGVAVVNGQVMVRVNLIEQQRIVTPPRFLVGLDIPTRLELKHGIYNEHVVQGRFLTLEDRGTLHCVVSRQIAEAHEKTVGSNLLVNGTEMTIVGIYDCQSQLLDVNILMDIEVLRKLARISSDTVSCFYVEQVPGTKNKELKARIEKTFMGRQWKPSGAMDTLNLLSGGGANPLQSVANAFDRWAKGTSQPPAPAPVQTSPQVSPTQAGCKIPVPSTVEVRSPEDWAEQFDTFSGDLDLFLTMISAVGFLIAVLSILNTMLMSVMERIGEFGILRAMGWTRREVMQLVMSESAVIGLVGGIVGVILGTAASGVANQVWPDRLSLHVSLGLALFAFLMSTLLGVAGGLYPAWKAAKLSPMDAIRRA